MENSPYSSCLLLHQDGKISRKCSRFVWFTSDSYAIPSISNSLVRPRLALIYDLVVFLLSIIYIVFIYYIRGSTVIEAFLSFPFLHRARDTSVLMALAEQLVSHRSNTSHRQRSLYLPFLFPLVRSCFVPLSHRLRPICGVRMFARFPCLSTLSRLGPKLSRQLVSCNVCNRGSLFNEKHLLLTKLKTNVSPQLVFSY